MADEISRTEKEIDEQEFVGNLPVDLNYTDFVQKFENVNLIENSQHKAASLPGSPIVKVSECLRSTRSQGGTPVLGSEELVLPAWKLVPPTPVQGLSPNSAAFDLLAGFAEGNIQVQGNAIHISLQRVTIELIEPGTGKVMGSIPDVNLVEGMEISEEKSIGEMLREIKSEVVEQINETIPDNGNFSMMREKQGKPSKVLSPVTKQRQGRRGRPKSSQNLPQSLGWGQMREQPQSQLRLRWQLGHYLRGGLHYNHQKGLHY